MVVYFFVILKFARKLRGFYLLKLHLNVGKQQFNMPVCCIVKCGARKTENQPQLSLHRFPKNEGLKKKWLEAIGEGNINPRHKEWYLCSLHFEESCFNRTLDVMRLHDNSVPTVFSAPDKKLHQESSVLCKTSNIKKSVVSFTSTVMPPLQSPHRIVETVHKEVVETENVKALKEKCVKQQQTIKRLNEMIRKKNKKIANLKNIEEDLRRKNCISMEQAVIEDLAGPKDFLKRQINKSKGLPTPNKYSDEIRQFAFVKCVAFVIPEGL